MKIGAVSQCTRYLNFRPSAIWPSVLPAVAWNEILIAGFNRAEVELSSEAPCIFISPNEFSLEEALSSLYPKLTFVELSRLSNEIEKLHLVIEWKIFCSRLGYHANSDWPRLFQIMSQAPDKLQEWWQLRDVSPRDLAPLKALPENLLARYFELALKAVAFEPSRSDGILALEWLVDIMLDDVRRESMALRWPEILKAPNFVQFREHIRQVRFQQTIEREESNELQVAKLPWPTKTKANWVRRGDADGVEIKLFAHSADDLTKLIAALENVATQWHQRSNELQRKTDV